MANVRIRQRRRRILEEANQHADYLSQQATKRSKRPAKYGSQEHRRRIREGVLLHFYGRPIVGYYQRPKKPFKPVDRFKTKTNSTEYFHRRKGRLPTQMR